MNLGVRYGKACLLVALTLEKSYDYNFQQSKSSPMPGERKYILETDKMLPGDIVLTARNSWTSKLIRKATAGEFSHAILYVGNGSYIHSDADGVHADNTQRLLLDGESSAKVFQLVNREPVTVEKLCTFARTQIGKAYSVPEAAKSRKLRSKLNEDESNRQFCSRLVAQAYSFAGVSVVTNPDYCYPTDIPSSKLLKEIEGCVREATESEIRFANSDSPLKIQAEATNYILESVRKLSGQDVQTFDQLVSFLLQNRQYDDAVCEIVKQSAYLYLWQIDCERNPWRYDPVVFLALNISSELKTETAKDELHAAEQQLRQYEFMRAQYVNLWQRAQLRYIALEIQLYMTLVDLTKKRIRTAKEVIARTSAD